MLVSRGDRGLLLLRVRCLLQKVSAALLPACLLACQENSFYLACGTSAGAGPWCVSESKAGTYPFPPFLEQTSLQTPSLSQ